MAKVKKIVDGVVVEVDDSQFVKLIENGVVVEKPISETQLKKKEQTEPTQAVQTQQAPTQEAPLPGLGGVSEEPTPSPSVGQGVLRGVDQAQPRGEAFISRASDLTRTDVGEPQVDGEDTDMVDIKLSPKDAEYIVDGKKVDKTYFKDFLYERDNAQAIFDGRINISVKNDPEMEQFASRQVQSRETNDVWDSLKSGVITIGSSVLGAQQMVGDFLEDLTGIQPTGFAAMEKIAREAAIKDLQKKAKEAQESRFQADGDFIDLVSNGDFSEAGNMAVNTVVESGPLSLTALAATAATGNPMAGFAVLAPITTGMTYSEQMTTEDEAIRNLSDTEKYLRATAFGLAEAGSEAISGKILGRSFKLFGKGVSDMVGRVASEFGEQAATDVAISSAKKTISEIMKNYGFSMAEEGAAEGLTQLTQNLTDAFLGVKDMSLEQVLEGVGNAIALGAASGGIMSTPGAAGQAISGVSKKVLDYKLSKKNGAEELTSEAKRMAEFNKIFADNLSDIESNIESRSEAVNATPNDMVSNTETVDLVEEKQKLEKEIEGKDPILTDGIKKRVGEINEELKKKADVDTVPDKRKGRLTKFSTPQDGIVGEVTYEDGTKKELTQEEYDALEKQEGLFDVETGTQPVAEEDGVNYIESLDDNELVTFNVETIDEVPDKFKEKAVKRDDLSVDVREKILGLPIGKKKKVTVKEGGYSYTITGLEAKEYAKEQQETVPTETTESAPIELKEGEIDITTVFKNPVEKNNEQAVAASNEFKDKAGEYDEGVNDPKFKEENTTVEEISVDDIVPTQEKLFEENLKSPSEGEPLVMKVGDKYYVEDGHHRIGNGINADNQTVSVRVYESDKAKQDAIQEQAAGEVPVQPETEAGKEVEEGKPKAEPEVAAEEGKEEVSEEEKVKAAKDNLNNVWEKWKQSQKNLGVVFDPKSKANEDMELLEAFLTYIKAIGVKTAKDIQKAFNDFTGGEATLDDAGAEFVSESVKEPVVKKPVSIASETTGLTLREQFTQGFREYTEAIKKLNKENIDKIKILSKEKLKELRESENKKRIAQRQKFEEAVDNVKTKLKEAIKNAKDDDAARKIFNDFISMEMKELEISELSRGKIKRLLGMSKNASKDSFDAIVDKGISLLVSQAKRNLNLDIKSAKGELKDLIDKGRFGTSTRTAQLLNSIPTDAIPVQYLKDYLDILEVLTSTAKPSAVQLNRLNEFMNSISQEIDSYINDMEFYAGEYNEYLEASKYEKQSKDYLDAKEKKAKDRTEAEKILIERVEAKRKEGFKERLSELGATEGMILFVENNFDRITSAASKMNKKGGVELTNKEKIAVENAKRKDAIALLNAMFPVKNGKRGIKNIGRFSGNKLALDIANFFNGIVPKDLKDLSAKQIESIVDIMENIENGMITPAMFDMMTTINATRDVEKISGAASGIVRAVDNAVESFYAIRNLIEKDITEKQEIVKNVQKKIDEALSLQSQEIGSIIKGMKGSAFYEIISSVTSAMSVATSQINKMKERTYFLFYNMKGSPVENTILISLYHRAREFEMLEGNEDPTILDPIEYLDRAILDEGNSYRKDILIDIRKKFLSNGTISSKDVLNEIEKRKGGELVKFMDETNLANRDKARSIAEIIRGIVFKEVDGYGASRAAEDGKADNLQDRVNRINNGSIVGSAKAGSINKRTVNTAKTFDAVSDFINQNADLIYEYELAEPLSTISKTTSIMKATGNADMRSLGKVIHGYISELLSDSFSMSMQDSGYWTSTLRSMTERMKSQMIFSLFVKPISETVAQLPKLLNPDSLTSFGALREATKGSKLSLSQKYDVLLKIGSTSAERAGGMSAESFYRPSYAQRRLMKSASKMEMAFLKAHLPIDKLRRLIEKLNNSRQRVPDRYGPVDIVIGRFAYEFKKITGEYPNFTRIINDGVYLSENKDAIQTARAKADQINNRLFAPSTPQETPKKGYTIPSLKLMPISRAVSSVWRYMWLLDTYSTTEQKTFLRGIKEMRDSLAENIKKDNYNSWSGIEDPSFMRGFAYSSSNVFSMIVYQTSRAVLFGLLETMIAYLTGDDEERESILDSFSSGFESGVRDVVILMPLARTPLPLKMPIFLAVRQLFESKYGKEMADKYMPSFLSIDPGGKIQREAAKMGPMGQGIASIMTAYTTSEKITNDILNTERGWKMSDVLMIGKTIGSLMLGADAQETKRIFGKWASSSRVKDSISASLYGDYDTESVLSDEIFSLYNELDKDKSIIPRDVSDSKKIKGVTYEINDQVIIDEMNAIRGKYIEQAFDNARRDYNKESDPNKKAEMLKEIYRKVNQNKKYEADILKMFAKHGEAVE